MLLGRCEGYLDQQHYFDQVLASLTLATHRLDCEQLQVGQGFCGCVRWQPKRGQLYSPNHLDEHPQVMPDGPPILPATTSPLAGPTPPTDDDFTCLERLLDSVLAMATIIHATLPASNILTAHACNVFMAITSPSIGTRTYIPHCLRNRLCNASVAGNGRDGKSRDATHCSSFACLNLIFLSFLTSSLHLGLSFHTLSPSRVMAAVPHLSTVSTTSYSTGSQQAWSDSCIIE